MDEYIASCPKNVRSILEEVRQTIKKEVPKAEETISYQMPTFKLGGKFLVSFAAWTNHIGLYPVPSGDATFRKEISPYIGSKSSVRFAIARPIPYDLVREVVKFRLEEISEA